MEEGKERMGWDCSFEMTPCPWLRGRWPSVLLFQTEELAGARGKAAAHLGH